MSVKDEVRAAQAAQFEDNDEMRSLTAAIYDSADALSPAQKRLLVRSALAQASGAMLQGAHHPDAATAFTMLANGLVAIAGYANETLREDLGETSTGDSKVDAVLDQFEGLVKTSLRASLSPEMRDRADEVVARVNARVEKGEDRDAALKDEYEKIVAEARAAGGTPDSGEEKPQTYGLYL